MKHPTRHISARLRKVSRGRQALSREITCTVKRINDDPSFRKLAKEIARHFAEIVVRVVVLSAVNQWARASLPSRQEMRASDPSETHRRTVVQHRLR